MIYGNVDGCCRTLPGPVKPQQNNVASHCKSSNTNDNIGYLQAKKKPFWIAFATELLSLCVDYGTIPPHRTGMLQNCDVATRIRTLHLPPRCSSAIIFVSGATNSSTQANKSYLFFGSTFLSSVTDACAPTWRGDWIALQQPKMTRNSNDDQSVSRHHPWALFVSGATASGKTTIAKFLASQLDAR